MPDLTLPHHAVLETLLGLQTATARTALAAVKLTRIRKGLTAEAEAIVAAFDEAGRRHARRGDDGTPVVRANAEGEPLRWTLTGTPFYEIADADAFAQEMQALMGAECSLTVAVRLKEADLEQLVLGPSEYDVGALLLPFVYEG